MTGTATETRVGKAPAGAHAISGSWRDDKQDVATSDAVTFTCKTSGGATLSMTTPTGQSYTAKLDGKEVPFAGDPGTTTVSLKRIGDSIEETDYRDGKAISVSKMTVSADGETMIIEVDDNLHGKRARIMRSSRGRGARKEPTRGAVDDGPSMNPSQRWEPSAAL